MEITAQDISRTSEILTELILKRKYIYMRQPVQMVLGGLLLPLLIDQGELDPNDPDIKIFLEKYSKDAIDQMLNPEPIEIPVEIPLEIIIKERPKFRVLKGTIKKKKRKKRSLTPLARDVLIEWFNRNQKLIPSDDPICVILTEKINNMQPRCRKISNMQISGYFSMLCQRAVDLDEEKRNKFFQQKMDQGLHTKMPYYSDAFLQEIKENWIRVKMDKYARKIDHEKIKQMKEEGNYRPIIADV